MLLGPYSFPSFELVDSKGFRKKGTAPHHSVEIEKILSMLGGCLTGKAQTCTEPICAICIDLKRSHTRNPNQTDAT